MANKDRLRANPIKINGQMPTSQGVLDEVLNGQPSQEIPMPDNALIPQGDGTLALKNFTVTRKGLIVDADASEADFDKLLPTINTLQSSMQWVIGDFMNATKERYGDGKYQFYAQALNIEPETLMNWASVCTKIQFSTRVENLSFGHHRLVTKMDASDQTTWLNRAIQNGWSVLDMRLEIKKRLTKKANPPALPQQVKRYRKDFHGYWQELESLGQGGRAELRQLAYDLIMEIDRIDPLEGGQ